MSENACTVLTLEERKFIAIIETAQREMFDKIFAAIDDASAQVAEGFRESGLQFDPPGVDYFEFGILQVMFLSRCGADLGSLQGGDAEIGRQIISNCQNIVDNYWADSNRNLQE